MLESGGRNKNKNKNSKIEESKKKKKKKELNNIFFFFKPLIKIKSNTKYLVFQLVQIHKFQVGKWKKNLKCVSWFTITNS